MNKRLLIAGGSGMIGTAVAQEARREGWEVIILSRNPGPGIIAWDPSQGTIDITENQNFDAIINLAGSPIAKSRWTKKNKKEISQSRLNACHTLETYLLEKRITTGFYLGASAIGIYGDKDAEEVNEQTPIKPHDDWFVQTVIEWENAHNRITALGIRTAILRIGIVLSAGAGALKEIINTPGFPVLSYFGDGDQTWPWIHVSDIARMALFCNDHPSISGTYLATSPNPVTNKYFTQTINKFISPKRIIVGVPKIIMSIILGEKHRVLFDSCNAISEKIQKEGFVFRFTKIEEAIKNLLN